MTQARARRPVLPDGDPDATRLAELRDLAAPWGPGRRGIDPDLLAERNVLLLRLRSRNPGVWSWRRLGELAGLSASVVGRVLGRGLVVSAPGPRRVAVIAAEVEARATDPRVRRLADLRAVLAGAPPRTHPVERAERARLVVDLWRGDPRIWSGRHLAIAAGTSPGWVTGVVKAALQASAGEGGVM